MVDTKRSPKVVVSLTSYPLRIDTVAQSIKTMLSQTVKPDIFYLWLSYEDFPKGDKSIPRSLRRLKRKGLTIRYVDDDLESHNKYYWAYREHPEDIIITVDDDIIYRPEVLETLLDSYERNPHAVSAMRAHRIKFDEDGNIKPYMEWQFEYMDELHVPRMDLLATGVCGVLYPPHSLDCEILTLDNIKNTCLFADDIWLKVLELANNVPVVVCSDYLPTHEMIDGTQEVALWHVNNEQGGNDKEIAEVFSLYNEMYGKEDTLISRIQAS